jgi:hypothetical protein
MEATASQVKHLDEETLKDMAVAFRDSPELWRPLVRHEEDGRYFVRLHLDEHVEAWLICWLEAQATGLHDHDGSAGAVAVCEGTLLEDTLCAAERGVSLRTVARSAGEAFSFDGDHIHDVRHDGGLPATSVHVYSPPIRRMGHFAIGADGTVRRRSVSYEEPGQVSGPTR